MTAELFQRDFDALAAGDALHHPRPHGQPRPTSGSSPA